MFRWITQAESRTKAAEAFSTVAEGLSKSYRDKLLPVEQDFDFHTFYSPPLTEADFSARPMVLLIGQYSAGKSTFIRHLLGKDYPGLRIGPEPTTDKFVAIVGSDEDQVIPGNAVVVDKTLPFSQLSYFGNNFLSRFEVAKMNCPVLQGLTLIDSPGVLSGEKQRLNRGYVFESVVKWWSDRVDMILILFDVNKLDISDEFRKTILANKGNDQKVHVLLNKADRCSTPQLMRVYGAMMWNLGKVMNTPEVARVYIGSFWDEPLVNDENKKLFESEETDLFKCLSQLPRGAATRKLNDLIKRARLAKVHAYLMDYLKKNSKSFFGTSSKKANALLDNLADGAYKVIAKERGVALGDFPDPAMMKEKLAEMDLSRYNKMSKVKMEALEIMLTEELPRLVTKIPAEDYGEDAAVLNYGMDTPFGSGGATEYNVRQALPQYVRKFVAAGCDGTTALVSAAALKPVLLESGLPNAALHKIWTLATSAKPEHSPVVGGSMNLWQFAVAQLLIQTKKMPNVSDEGRVLPDKLPPTCVPSEDDLKYAKDLVLSALGGKATADFETGV